MKRLSIGTISALFLAGAISPAVVAATNETFQAESSTQSQSVSQLPGSPQTPGAGQTPGSTQAPNQLPPGQTPGQGPGQFPPGSAPGTTQQTPGQPTPGQTQTPGSTQTPGQVLPGQTPGQGPGQFPPGSAPDTMQQTPRQAPATMQTPVPGAMQPRRYLEPGAMLSPDTVNPFQLTNMASSGQLEEAGISGGSYLRNSVRMGNVRGRHIVEAAADQGYISRAMTEDGAYIDQVNQFLRMQERDWRN